MQNICKIYAVYVRVYNVHNYGNCASGTLLSNRWCLMPLHVQVLHTWIATSSSCIPWRHSLATVPARPEVGGRHGLQVCNDCAISGSPRGSERKDRILSDRNGPTVVRLSHRRQLGLVAAPGHTTPSARGSAAQVILGKIETNDIPQFAIQYWNAYYSILHVIMIKRNEILTNIELNTTQYAVIFSNIVCQWFDM